MIERPELNELVEKLAMQFADNGQESVDPSHRVLAQSCLQTVFQSGFEINPAAPVQDAVDSTGIQEQLSSFKRTQKVQLRDLIDLWHKMSDERFKGNAEIYTSVAEQVLKAGEPLVAYDILRVGLARWKTDVRLRQLSALALARSGAPRRAAKRLHALVDDGHEDEETLGILARTYKDLWESESDPKQQQKFLAEAYRLYRRAFDVAVATQSADGALYAGINAATMALLQNQELQALELAKEVSAICRSKSDFNSDYWAVATLGECALICGRIDEARNFYQGAVELAGSNYADIASTRRNAKILFAYRGMDLKELSQWLPVPRVAVFSGHLIDRAGAPQRFPHSQIETVFSRLKKVIEENQIGVAYSAAACGSDLLFLKALRLFKKDYRVILPFDRDSFCASSVAVDDEYPWETELNSALADAVDVSIINQFSQQAELLHFEYANQVMTGLAMLHSQSLGTEVVPIAVWDERPPRGPGGTGSVVDLWKRLGWSPIIINPTRLPTQVPGHQIHAPPPEGDVRNGSKAEPAIEFEINIRAMLFADVVGYSKITEEEIPIFVNEFMGRIATCVRQSGVTIESGNSWGDAIYFVFTTVEDAGRTALKITEMVADINWKNLGFGRQLNLRTGLHVGPVYRVTDPVTQKINHTGAHVNRAARIEPIAPAGEVYASEAFAALAAAENIESFRCDYVGITPMAKGYGDFPTYHVRRVGS